MGLDMYLERMSRFEYATAKDVSAVEDYFDWKRAKEEGSEYAQGSFRDWANKDTPPKKYRDFYKKFYKATYSDWDKEHKYPWFRIVEEVGYWRKANQIHNWFVENVQDGIDDCDYHHEVTKEILEELLDVCERVLDSCELVEGEINNGYEYTAEKGRVPIIVKGKYVKDPSVAEKLLPTTCGFFFGGTDYDEYYVDDIKHTIDVITKVLETTDFETQMIYYGSSW